MAQQWHSNTRAITDQPCINGKAMAKQYIVVL